MTLANILGLLGLLSIIGLIIIYIIKPNFQQKFVSSTFIWRLSLKYKKRRIPISKLRNLLLIICQLLILTSCSLILAQPVRATDPTLDYIENIYIVDASVSSMALSRNPENTERPVTSRFERSIQQIKERVNEVFETDENGKISIILAGDEAKFLTFNVGGSGSMQVNRVTKDMESDDGAYLSALNIALDNIIQDVAIKPLSRDDNNLSKYCTYGSADVEGAMELADDVLRLNPDAEVFYFTGKEYKGAIDNLTVVDVGTDTERNVAILDGSATLNVNGTYVFTVDLAIYGADARATVYFTAEGVNANPKDEDNLNGKDYLGTDITSSDNMYCPEPIEVDLKAGETTRITFDTWEDLITDEERERYKDNPEDIVPADPRVTYSFKSVTAIVKLEGVTEFQFYDALTFDDEFRFYGGEVPNLDILYVSTLPNPFMKAIDSIWRSLNANVWNINVTEMTYDTYKATPEAYLADLYIFEHAVPPEVPEDGIVFLFDPEIDVSTSSSTTRYEKYGLQYLGQVGNADDENGDHIAWDSAIPIEMTEVKHPLNSHIAGIFDSTVQEVKTTKYTRLGAFDDNFEKFQVLASIHYDGNNDPALMINDEDGIFVMTFDIHATNFAMKPAFPEFMIDLFDHFFPQTLSRYSYTVGDTVSFNAFAKKVDWASRTKDSMRGDEDAQPFETFPASLKLNEWGTYTLTQQLKSSVQVKTQLYAKIPSSESDIKNVAGNTIEGPHVSKVEEIPYEDLLIWFAAALVALLFAEWWLQSRDNF